MISIDASFPYSAQPVVPGDVAAVYQDSLVVAMIAKVFEEDAAAEQ